MPMPFRSTSKRLARTGRTAVPTVNAFGKELGVLLGQAPTYFGSVLTDVLDFEANAALDTFNASKSRNKTDV